MTIEEKAHTQLPNLIIIGAMKAGTTSLHHYLSAHPEIYMSKTKELNFFNTSLNWQKGVDWYKAQFSADYPWRGESSPNYSKWEGTAERMFKVIPEAKLIYILRHPVDRFVSECNHRQLDPNTEVMNIKQGKVSEIYTNGLYHKWYKAYTQVYSKEQILVITSENLKHERKRTLIEVFNFLKLDFDTYDFNAEKVNIEQHKTDEKPLAREAIQKLNRSDFYSGLKKIIRPLIPILKPIQRKLFYKERVIKVLSAENKQFLKAAYKKDIENLEKSLNVILNYI
jgi:hypothetical protein